MAEEQSFPQPRPWWQDGRVQLAIGVVVVIAAIAVIVASGNTSQQWAPTKASSGHPLVLAVDPAKAGALLAGNEQGQVLVTTDNGDSWQVQQGGLPSGIAVSALLPLNGKIVAGTSDGVYISADGGAHWMATSTGLPTGDGVDAIIAGSPDGKTLLAGTELHGIYLSSDGGQSWSPASTGLPAHADIYGLLPSADFHSYYAALIGAGVYISHNGGSSWSESNQGLPGGIDAFALALTQQPPKNTSLLLVGTSAGVFRSTDGGATWQASDNGMGTTRVISLAVSPADATVAAAGTDGGVYVSLSGGTGWSVISGSPKEVGAVVVPSSQPLVIYAAADKIYRYPPANPSPAVNLGRLVGIILLIGVIGYTWLRQQRTSRQLSERYAKEAPPPGAPGLRSRLRQGNPSASDRSGSHIRGGPPPPQSPFG
jgi:photosystem II stability/assembly factor-like uncharacterized protein